MPTMKEKSAPAPEFIAQRTTALFREQQLKACKNTDRLFAAILIFQWLAGICVALWISPRAWAGNTSQIHFHVWAAVFLGGAITSLPVVLALMRPGHTCTRHAVAIGQMLMGALLIHLTGGRIETHFQVFVSLAILAFYRDWRVLVSATVVVAVDHWFRGVYWPQSVYGTLVVSPWRWLEHAGWVLCEDTFLIWSIHQSLRQMMTLAERQAQLETLNANVENTVVERTRELKASEELFRSLSAASPIGIYQTDAVGLCNYTNAQWQELAGLSNEDALTNGWTRAVHPADRQFVSAEWSAAVQAGKEFGLEFRMLTPQNELRWVHSRSKAMLTSDGKLTGYVGTVEDITERKRTEQRDATQYRVTRILAESATVAIAAPKILEAICEGLDWDFGAEWNVDQTSKRLLPADTWHQALQHISIIKQI